VTEGQNGSPEDAATWYYLWVDGPSGNVIASWYPAGDVCSGGTCSVTPDTELVNGDYSWAIQTWNPVGYGLWSSWMDFIVDAPVPTPPGAATLISPEGTIEDNTPPYAWNEVDTATWYYLWVDGPSGNVIASWYQASDVCSGGTCSVTPDTELVNGDYSWAIQTWNPVGYGLWSSWMDFTVDAPVPTPPGAATLISPEGTISDNTPTYIWNAVAEPPESAATWYYLYVDGPSGNVHAKWYTAEQACSGGTCSVTPDTTLENGDHTWWIDTWNEQGYGPWSDAMSFTVSVASGGFNSQFNGSAAGWTTHSGSWWIASNAWYTTYGVDNKFASASYNATYSDLDYEARMYRSGCDGCANTILIRGQPTPLGSDNVWDSSYVFQYTRSGSYSVWKSTGSGNYDPLQGWTSTSSINQGNAWNILRVWASGSNINFYINGILVWSGTDTSLTSGRVGVWMYSDGTSSDQLWVDWATLSVVEAGMTINDIVSAEQQTLNDAAQERGDGNKLFEAEE
jgi:hypothetical protein